MRPAFATVQAGQLTYAAAVAGLDHDDLRRLTRE